MSASRFCHSCAFVESLGAPDYVGFYCVHPRLCFSDVGYFDTCSLFKPANDEDVPRDEIDEGFVSGGVR